MKQLLKILHRLSYFFVIPIFVVLSLFYTVGTFLFNIPYWILTGKSLLEVENTIMDTVIDWIDTHYPIFTKTEDSL